MYNPRKIKKKRNNTLFHKGQFISQDGYMIISSDLLLKILISDSQNVCSQNSQEYKIHWKFLLTVGKFITICYDRFAIFRDYYYHLCQNKLF